MTIIMRYRITNLGFVPVMLVLVITLFACSEEERLTYLDQDAPAPVAVDINTVQVENFPGISVLRYQLPKDDNLLSVKAVYQTAPGMMCEAKASRYVDSLLLEGYAQAGDYQVQLYSVGKNGKESQAVNITVSPLASPIYEAIQSLELQDMFGGIRGKFENPSNALLTVVLSADTAHTGNQTWLRSFVLGNTNPSFAYLGLSDEETEFSVYVKDRWGNKSEARTFTCTPMLEEPIDKQYWSKYELESDETGARESPRYRFECIWDGITVGDWNYFFISYDKPLPRTFTIKLGQRVRLSRFVMHHAYNFPYERSFTPKKIELYVSDSDAPGDDLFGGDWQLIAQLESTIPSGLAEPTQEDKDHARFDGENMFIESTDEIPNPYVPAKYLRVRVLKNWDEDLTEASIAIGEIDLFGQVLE